MYFAKDEIIELNDNKKYLVIDTAILNDIVYYQIKKLDQDEKKVIGNPIYITAINKQGKLFINDKIPSDTLLTIKKLFEN